MNFRVTISRKVSICLQEKTYFTTEENRVRKVVTQVQKYMLAKLDNSMIFLSFFYASKQKANSLNEGKMIFFT